MTSEINVFPTSHLVHGVFEELRIVGDVNIIATRPGRDHVFLQGPECANLKARVGAERLVHGRVHEHVELWTGRTVQERGWREGQVANWCGGDEDADFNACHTLPLDYLPAHLYVVVGRDVHR